VTSWANDSHRFINMHWNELRKNPLEVYRLFAFAPKSSIFITIYAKSIDFPHPVVTMGLEDDWPSHISITVHKIGPKCLSNCGNWFLTGGTDGSYPVYGLWNVKLGDGEVYIHPCGVTGCRVTHVAIHLHDTALRLQTFCKCGSLYRWDTSSSPPALIEELKFDRHKEGDDWEFDENWNWSEDGRMVIILNMREDDSGFYSLWKDDRPEEYYELPSGHWKFSPERGDKIACTNIDSVEVWDSITCRRLFKQTIFQPLPVVFSPDARTLLVPKDPSINCLSAENGTILWNIEAERYFLNGKIPKFFCNGTMILISRGGNLVIINAADGSTVYEPQKRPGYGFSFFTYSVDERIIMTGGINGDVLFWNPRDNSGIQKYGKTVSGSTLQDFSWQHMTLIETCTHGISFSYIDLSWPFFPQSDPEIFTVLLSHNGLNLAIVSDNSLVTLWDTSQGIQLVSTFLCPIYSSKEIKVEFTKNSSHLLVWRTISSEMQIIDIAQRSIKSLDVLDFRTAAFFSTSRRILTLDGHGGVNVNSFEGELLDTPGHLNFSPSILLSPPLTISSDDRLMAMIYRGSLVIKEIFGHTPKFEWPGQCIGMAFTTDCEHILVAEHRIAADRRVNVLIVSHLRLTDMALQNRWTWKRGDLRLDIITRYDTNALVVQTGQEGMFPASRSLISCFDLSNGKRIIPPLLHQEGRSILLSKHRIMQTVYDGDDPDDATGDLSRLLTFNGSCSNHLVMRDWAQVVTVDMSSVIQYT
jgi:hypothetical protein